LERGGFGGAEVFSNYIKVTEGGEKGLGWVAEEKFGSEAADGDVSAADGCKEGRVGGRAERAGYVGGEGSVF
jgi:hypothetical protein